MKNYIHSYLLILSLFGLTACSSDIDDARKLGFNSVKEMKYLESQGYKNKKEFLDHEAKVRAADVAEKAAEKEAAEKAAEKEAAKKAAAEKAAAEKASANAIQEAALPWLDSQQRLCDEYKMLTNEIKKDQIYEKSVQLLENSSVQNAVGTLKELTTDLGLVHVTIIVGNGIKFRSKGFNISTRDKMSKVLESLETKSCVIFSISHLSANSVLEKNKVCDRDYFTRFTNIKPCS